MADDRSASKQRRSNQNRAARQSLAARRAAAAEAAAKDEDAVVEAPVKGIDNEDVDVPDDDSVEAPPRGRRGLMASLSPQRPAVDRPARRGRPTGPSPVPEHGSGVGGYISGLRAVPGGMWVLASLVLALLTWAMFTFILKFGLVTNLNQVVAGEAAAKAAHVKSSVKVLSERRSVLSLIGWSGALFFAMPIYVAAVALAFAFRPQRRKVWFGAALVMAMLVFLAGLAANPLNMLVVGLLGWGSYQTSKAERV